MISLIVKELKQLLPFLFLWLCLVALFYGAELASIRIDEQSYVAWCREYCDVGSNADVVLFAIVFYLIASYGLFPREFDESTIDFLRSLPIGSKKIFCSKIVAAWILFCFLILFERVLQAGLLSFNTQTITGKTYWQNDLLFTTRDMLFAFVVLSHGVFLSWFRTTGLIIYSGYLIALIWLEQIKGASGIYSIFSVFKNEYDGPNLLVDWYAMGFHVIVAFVLLIISYSLWTNTDSRPRTPGSGKFAKVLPGIVSVLAFALVASYMAGMIQQASIESEQSGIQRRSTEHYAFSYRQEDEPNMLKLQAFAEADYQALVSLLGAASAPRIQADMTSDSEHALGLASWKKIRMVLTLNDNVDPLIRRVLSHETAHVFQSVESNRKLVAAGNSVGFFIEGMAQFTSFAIVPDVKSRESNWLVSSIAWQRHNIKFDEMANRRVFESLYDPELLYGIGDIWVSALAKACGQASLGNFLRAVGRDNAPPNLSGSAFWRNHLQYIGCELETVNDQWRAMMRDVVDNRRKGTFPYFENVVVSRADTADLITISADLKAGELGDLPDYFHVRIQSEASLANTVSPVLNGRLIRVGDAARVEFSVLPRLIDGSRFRYQLGYIPLPNARIYFDKWRSGSVPD